METLLVISDVHNRVDRVEKIIANAGADKVILTGDYFDDFGDSHIDAQKTAEWLKESLTKENRIHLVGNHDQCYIYFNHPYTRCSGYTESKRKVIYEVLTRKDLNKLKFFHFEQGYLFTHAGLHSGFLPKNLDIKDLESFLIQENKMALKALEDNDPHWFFMAGYARGGISPVGGLTWLDFNREFYNVAGVNQVVGHTPQKEPRWIDNSLCLDTHLNHYAIISNANVKIFKYTDL